MQDTFPLHPPSVTVDCCQLSKIFTIKNSKFFCTLRLFPQIDIQPPKYGFPCVISGHTIFEVSAHNQTPTSLNASAKKTRMKRFVPMLPASFCPLLASGAALLTTHFFSGSYLVGIESTRARFEWIHQLPR